MDYKQLTKVISTKRYRQEQFNQDLIKMTNLIKAANQMEVNQEAFKIVRILIRCFRFPILILFRRFYQKIERQGKVVAFAEDQMKTASLVVSILEEKDYPHLRFYSKAGVKPVQQEFKHLEDPGHKQFREFILKIDSKIYSIFGDKPNEELDKIKFTIRQIEDYNRLHPLSPIFSLCIQNYKQLALEKKKELQSILDFRMDKMSYQRNKTQISSIFIQQGSNTKEIKDLRVCQDHLCCRPYFYKNEIIDEPQTITQEYKNYSYPFSKSNNQILLKTIVGFLNGKGGIIYIGIKQNNETKKRIVVGDTYNESLKEDVLKHFRQLGQRISPEIVNNQLYKLQYVPIRDESAFLPGKYIIRLRISKGQKDELYSYKCYNQQQRTAFRTQNEVLVRSLGQQILEYMRQKLSKPDEPQQSNHPGACKKPELGRPVYQMKSNNNESESMRFINKKFQPGKQRSPEPY